MKKTLFILIVLLTQIKAFSQTVGYFAAKDSTTPFGTTLPSGRMILDVANHNLWSLDSMAIGTKSLSTSAKTSLDKSLWEYATTNTPYNYGNLYNWYAVNTGKLAPIGWSVPSNADVQTLINTIGPNYFQCGLELRSSKISTNGNPIGWDYYDDSNIGTNLQNFNSLPSGIRINNGNFALIGTYFWIWTNSTYNSSIAYSYNIPYEGNTFFQGTDDKKKGMAVRPFRPTTQTEDTYIDGTYCDDVIYNGDFYKTVKIGTQVWFSQNLKTTKYNNGADIPNVTDNSAWAALTTDAYCTYNNAPLSTYEDATYYYSVITGIKPKNSQQIAIPNMQQGKKSMQLYIDTASGLVTYGDTAISTPSWSLTGNTLSGTEKFGSKNSVALPLYVNDSLRMKIYENNKGISLCPSPITTIMKAQGGLFYGSNIIMGSGQIAKSGNLDGATVGGCVVQGGSTIMTNGSVYSSFVGGNSSLLGSGDGLLAYGGSSIKGASTRSTALSNGTVNGANYSTAIGQDVITNKVNQIAIGLYNDSSVTNEIFGVGVGTANNNRENGLSVLNDGSVLMPNIGYDATQDTLLAINPSTGKVTTRVASSIVTDTSGLWQTNGNNVTSPNNKIGTTNNADVQLYSNNTKRGFLDSLGYLQIGNSTCPLSTSNFFSANGTKGIAIVSSQASNVGHNLLINYTGGSSSVIGANQTFLESSGAATTNGSLLGQIGFAGSASATAASYGSLIQSYTTQLWTASNQGSSLVFSTNQQSTVNAIIRLVLNSSGNIGLSNGANAAPTTPTNNLSFNGQAAYTFGGERNTTANTNGNNLLVSASGCTSASTSKNGGDLILNTRAFSTGKGKSAIVGGRWGTSAAAPFTSDNIYYESFRVNSTNNSSNAVNDTLFSVVLGADSTWGAVVNYGVRITDNDSLVVETGTLNIQVIKLGGVITGSTSVISSSSQALRPTTNTSGLVSAFNLILNGSTVYLAYNGTSNILINAGDMKIDHTIITQTGLIGAITQW